MRISVLVSVVLLGIVASIWLVAQEPSPLPKSALNAKQHYSLTASGDDVFLLDSLSGSTWILNRRNDGRSVWLPVPKLVNEEEITKWQNSTTSTSVAAGRRQVSRDLKQVMLDNGYKCIPLERLNTGFLCLTVQLDGKACYFFLDTGAARTHMDRKRTKEHGFVWEKFGNVAGHVGEPVTRISNVSVGGFRLGPLVVWEDDLADFNERLLPYKDRQVDGMLGADLLDRHLAVIDYVGCNLFLHYRTSGSQDSGKESFGQTIVDGLRFSLSGGSMRIDVVAKGSFAEKAGLRVKDLLVKIDDKKIENANDIQAALVAVKPGQPVTFEVMRNGETVKKTGTFSIVFVESN